MIAKKITFVAGLIVKRAGDVRGVTAGQLRPFQAPVTESRRTKTARS